MSRTVIDPIDFDGAVECRRDSGTINLVLRGRAGADGIEALFAGASAQGLASLPTTLHAVHLSEPTADAVPRRFRLAAQELRLEFSARSLQLHRDAARQFFAAVPTRRVPLGRRVGWTVLLSLLRVPGVETLLVKLRGNA